MLALVGCGSGGYAGGGIVSLSSSAVTIDAGQSFEVTATLSGSPTVSWSLTSSACTGSGCGSLASTSGASNTYTAPAGLTSQLKLTLTATVAGTRSASVVSITVNPDPVITGTPPPGVVGVAYSTTLTASGGTPSLKWSLASGSLPPGLTFDPSTGIISGTPTADGTSMFTVQVVDSSDIPFTVTAVETIVITSASGTNQLSLTGNPPSGIVGAAYSTSLQATGGTSPYTFSVYSGSLPSGLALSPTSGIISGTPTTSGASTFTAEVQDASGLKATASFNITITAATGALTLTNSMLPNGTVGVPYSATISVAGGTAPYSCVFTAGTLPAGLSLSGCVVSGTPTVAGTANLTVKATDSSNPAATVSGPESITIVPAPALTITSPPDGTVGVPYTGSIGVAGGTAPYNCVITAGTLPSGLSLSSGCKITGTPTNAGTSALTIKANDASNPAIVTSGPITITITPAPLAITTGTLPNGTVGVAYTATIGVSGGTPAYSCTITAGVLPAGLSLGPNCLVSGTPTTAETANLTVKAVDSSNPSLSTSGPVSITIVPAPALVISSPPPGVVGIPYTGPIGVGGGKGPYTCQLTAGTLPSGLSISNCTITGTPGIAGSTTVTIKATDSSTPTTTTSGPVTITINSAPLSIATGQLPNGTVGTPYNATIGVSGGKAPYTCAITSGTLPSGLSLGANCLVSGTPTIAETVNLTVKATDSSSPVEMASGPVSLTINPAPPVLKIGNPPSGTVNVPYTGTIPVTGGTGPYTCTLTSGTLPTGLSLSDCMLTGTPTSPGSTTITVSVGDSSSPPASGTGPVVITIGNPLATLTLGNPPTATVGMPYTGSIGVSGGTAPYSCALISGTVPAGLTLNNCTLSGTPTVAAITTLTVKATDSANPQNSVTGPVVVTVNPVSPLTLNGSLPNAVLGQAYTQTLQAAGGIPPYTYALTAGSLPAGLTLSTTGVISGTPTAVGASSFTVTATDTEPTPQTASLPLVLLVTYPTTANDSELDGPYAFLFQGYDDVAAGLFAYKTATAGSFTADGRGVLGAGELDSNHQNSNPAGATIDTNAFVGTYQIGADERGLLTITTLNADGTTAQTSTYAIAVKAPVAPATTTAQGSLIEFDNNQLRGTKGSGTFLQQTSSSFSSGLAGGYAFGLQGDTPCLPTCTIGIVAGPVASVGQFAVDGAGSISSGFSDANIADAKFTNEALTGSYGAVDGNGRLPLSLITSGTPIGIYPSDYAVYMVNANRAFIVSTNKHSEAILLAGSAQSQVAGDFSNSSLTGPFDGYENSAANPGLVGATLQNTLNLSTATIFRATGDGAGTCDVTNVDIGGVTQLVNGLTGLGSGSPVINALLGTYASTGNAACNVDTNGRGTLNYPVPNTALALVLASLGLGDTPPPARVVYLVSPDRGYFLETGYAGLGQIEPQTGEPFSLASFSGTYIYGEAPASSVATINASGFIAADGAGNAISTEDLNVGVGTINVLQTGIIHHDTYTGADANTPADGRFFLNDTTVVDTSVLYVISPGRFVLLDTNPLTTSPTVNVLY